MFLQKAIDFSKDTKHPVLVMAPPNCMGNDFLVLQDKGLVAVQVKSNTVTEPKKQEEQKEQLRRAAKTISEVMPRNLPMQFMAMLGSNYDTDDLDFPCLKREDLVLLIPPFLRQLSGLAAGEE